MSEILTESFCERCGTRYTFESARPKIRLKGVKVLSRGLKNFVLSDDTTMDEAMAAARSETDRESTAQQLDAFHKTFNFCMSCRQYTCPNCWNEVEARCQSCAPLPEPELAVAPEVLPPAFPGLATLTEPAPAVESPNGTNGHVTISPEEPAASSPRPDATPDMTAPAPSADGEPAPAVKASNQTAGLLRRFRPGQNLDDELAAFERERSTVEPEAAAEAPVEVEAAAERAAEAEPQALVDIAARAAELAAVEVEAEAEAEAEAVEPAEAVEAEAEAEAAEPAEAVEAEAAAAVPAGEAQAQEELVAEPPAQAGVMAEPETPAQAAQADVQPTTPPAADVVEQPTWQITAPDGEVPATAMPVGPDRGVPVQASAPSLPPAEPHWPAKPEWPAPQVSAGLPFLGRPAQPQGGVESLWAASNRELTAAPPTPAPGRTTSGIQPCISCGLSLSANARFCRRCGTLQGS